MAAGTAAGSATRLSRTTFMPASRDSATSVSRAARVGCGRPAPSVAAAAQDADDLAQVLQCLVRALPDDAGRPGDLGAGRVGAELQGPGVHAEQGEAVGEHVVHLAGDVLAGQALGLFGAERGLVLGADRRGRAG